MIKVKSKLIAWVALAFMLVSCASEVSLYHPIKVISQLIKPQVTTSLDKPLEAVTVFKPEPVFIQQKGPHGSIQSDEKITKIQDIETKSLTITMNYAPQGTEGFSTQSLRCGDIAKLKVYITGIGISSPIYPAGVDGNNNIDATAGCTISATIPNVPFGTARIATVEAHTSTPTLIPGSTVKAAFDVSASPTNVNIGFNTTPVGATVEQIKASNTFIAAYMSLPNLQTLINTATGVSGTFPNLSYTYHPSLIDTNQLATDLLGNGGNSGALIPGDYDNEAYSTVTGTLAGLLGTDTASIQITDPASPVSVNNGNGAFSFTSNVKNGTWVTHAEATGYTASSTPSVTVGAGGSQSVGTITFTWATTPNISSLSGSLSANSGIVGSSLTINGTGFHPQIAGNTVTINGTNATVTAASPTQLTVTVPSTGDGNVQVTVGTVASNTVAFQVFPTISITAPAAAALVNGTSSAIATSFTSGNSVSQVEFFLDGVGGTSLGTDNTGPTYSLNWNTTSQTSGAHTLVARITDSASHQVTSSAVNITIDQLPVITSITPNTATAPGLGYPIRLTAAATDDLRTFVNSDYTWSCIANCGDSSFNQTMSPVVYWTAPSTDQGAAATIQLSITDTVNSAVTSTVNLNYLTGTANVNVFGVSSLEEVSTYAGTGGGAATNGSLLQAQFPNIAGMAFDSTGNLYVASGHAIRKITPHGVVSTFAGSGAPGFNNATGTAAQFNDPDDIVIDSSNNLFVSDKNNHIIRHITPGGVVTTFAGTQGSPGLNNATGTAAQFNMPTGLGIDTSNNIYVADAVNNRIRKITPGGVVTTFAGNGTAALTDGAPGTAEFNSPEGVDVDNAGNVYVADFNNHAIRKIDAGGTTSTLAGTNTSGFVNATGAAARFNNPIGVAVDGAGNVYVNDATNNVVRKVTAGGVVTTHAGAGGAGAYANGLRTKARFNIPGRGIIIGSNGLLYVGDNGNLRIRLVKP